MNPLDRKGSIEQQGHAFELAETQGTAMPFIKSGAHAASRRIKNYLADKATSKFNQKPFITFTLAGLCLAGVACVSNRAAGPTVALLAMGIGLALTGILEGTDYVIKGVAKTLDAFSEQTTNPAKLRQDIIDKAKEQNIMPDELCDPISHDWIEDPVTFPGDPTQTIYDRASVENLRRSARESAGTFNRTGRDRIINPMTGSGTLDCDFIVSLPGVKEQIEDLRQHFGGKFPS